tara:strand:+ start:155 stop:394 length:240 start_codon:yes stop_codon:yes gene_type:complete
MASLAAKMGPKELAVTGGIIAAITLYSCSGGAIQEVQALEKKKICPKAAPENTSKLQRRPSWEVTDRRSNLGPTDLQIG